MAKASQFTVVLFAFLTLINCHLAEPKVKVEIPALPYQFESIITAGLEKLRADIALRDEMVKHGFDFQNAENIPQLESRMAELKLYYREAAKGRGMRRGSPEFPTTMSENLEKVLKQMDDTFANKRMTLRKWVLFHLQLGRLFSSDSPLLIYFGAEKGFDFGSLDESKVSRTEGIDSALKLRRVFPSFAYEKTGVLGLATLNHAFANDILLIAAPTSPDLVADTNHYNAYDFMIHDVGHFRAFSSSAYAFRRTLGRLNPILNKIDSQRNPAERLKDHLALFFLVHEFPPSGFGSTSYMETVEDVVRTGVSVLTSDKTYQFFRFEEFVPLFKEVLPSQDYIEGDNKHNFLALCHAFADKYAPFQTVDESVNKKRSLEDINTDLEKGLKYATDAVALREKIARRGQDYNKNNIPELESQLPEIKTNFENATQDKTRRQTFYKVLQLIKKDFARKKVTLPRWSNFLAWVNYVAYEYIYPGMKLELGSEWSLPSFIFYFPETSMSAKASNFARVHNLKPIFFSRSSFNPRFITNENGLADAVAFYDQIDTNRDLVTRAENHLALHVLFERKALEMEGLKKNIRVAKLKEASDWLMSHLLLSRLDLKDLIFAHFARGDVELDKIADDQFRVTTFGDNGKQNRVDIVTLKKNTPNEITFEYDFKGRKEVVSSAFQPLDHFDVEALNLIRHLGYEPSGENLTGIMKHLLDGLISESEKTP